MVTSPCSLYSCISFFQQWYPVFRGFRVFSCFPSSNRFFSFLSSENKDRQKKSPSPLHLLAKIHKHFGYVIKALLWSYSNAKCASWFVKIITAIWSSTYCEMLFKKCSLSSGTVICKFLKCVYTFVSKLNIKT